MRRFGILNYVLVVAIVLSLLGVSLFSVINRNFKDVPSTLKFLEKANVYTNLSTIVQLEIQKSYPAAVTSNIILTSIANKLVDTVVTPGLVEKIAEPALKLSYRFAAAPTSIVDKSIVVDTTKYKQQASNALATLDLPRFILVNANLIVDQVPQYLTIVNLEKHPNSVFGLIIRARTLLQYNKTALGISWVVVLASFAILILYNTFHLKRLLLVFWIGFGISGLCLILLYICRSWFFGGNASIDPLTTAQNTLVFDVMTYMLGQILHFSYVYIPIAVVSFIVWKFVHLEKLQKKIDKTVFRFEKKVHVPEVEIKIK